MFRPLLVLEAIDLTIFSAQGVHNLRGPDNQWDMDDDDFSCFLVILLEFQYMYAVSLAVFSVLFIRLGHANCE